MYPSGVLPDVINQIVEFTFWTHALRLHGVLYKVLKECIIYTHPMKIGETSTLRKY